VNAGRNTERVLHQILKRHRKHGEWFDTASEVVHALQKKLEEDGVSEKEQRRILYLARCDKENLP
jgi:hypothetical protein